MLNKLKHSIRLLLHYLKFGDVPVPQQIISLFSNAKNCYIIPLSFPLTREFIADGLVFCQTLILR
jgi:hypothetical protein